MFKEKYNKYKYKYLSLNKLLNQKGQGGPPHKVLVVGGGNPNLYGEGFYEVGNHPTSNFGAGRDWNCPQFWKDLCRQTKGMTFDIMIIDKGSLSWFNKNCIDFILIIIAKRLALEGIFLLEGPHVRNDHETDISVIIRKNIENRKISLNNIGRIGCGKVMDNMIYTIYSRQQGKILESIDRSGINGDILPGSWDERGFIIINPDFVYVTELNQIEFIKNRFLTILP